MNYWTLLLITLLLAPETGQDPASGKFTAGPMVGVVQREGVRVWCRAAGAGQTIDAILVDAAGAEVARASAVSSESRDFWARDSIWNTPMVSAACSI